MQDTLLPCLLREKGSHWPYDYALPHTPTMRALLESRLPLSEADVYVMMVLTLVGKQPALCTEKLCTAHFSNHAVQCVSNSFIPLPLPNRL